MGWSRHVLRILSAGAVLAALSGALPPTSQEASTAGAASPSSSNSDGPFRAGVSRARSNDVLIKVKQETRSRVREGDPRNTGIASLDEIGRQHNLQGFQRVGHPASSSETGANIFAWYSLSLGGEDKNIEINEGPLSSSAVADSSAKELLALRDQLKKDPSVEAAELDYQITTDLVPNDPYYSTPYPTFKYGTISQWAPQYVSAPSAWDNTMGDPSIKIAIVDTGVDTSHPDLSAKVVSQYSFVARNSADGFGHGTHVAGIAAASTNNGTGVAGICPRCSIMSVQVLGADGSGSTSNVAAGIQYAADAGARVINLSLGGSQHTQIARDALDYAFSKNALPVVAMGNSNSTDPGDLAYWYSALSVAAVDQSGAKASFSNYGPKTDVAAPGVAILSTMPTYLTTLNTQYGYKTNYDALSGTSMATPVVSGIAGLVASRNPGLTAAQIKGIIEASAGDGATFNSATGFGVVNAAKAVALAAHFDTAPPTVGIVSPAAGTTVTRNFTLQLAPTDNVGVHHIDLVRDGTRFGVPMTRTTQTQTKTKTKASAPQWSETIASTLWWNGTQSLQAVTFDTGGNATATSLPFLVRNTYVSQTASANLCWPTTATCNYYFWAPNLSLQYPAVVHLQASRTITSLVGGDKSTVLLLGGDIAVTQNNVMYVEGLIVAGNTEDFYPSRPFCGCAYNTYGTWIAGWLGKTAITSARVNDTVVVTYPQ